MLGGLILSFLFIFPMSFVQSPFQLGVCRFLLGFSTGALMPSVNTLISKITPMNGVGRIFSFNQMFTSMGQVAGPMVGSFVANGFGYRSVFIATSLLILMNITISFFNFKHQLSIRELINEFKR